MIFHSPNSSHLSQNNQIALMVRYRENAINFFRRGIEKNDSIHVDPVTLMYDSMDDEVAWQTQSTDNFDSESMRVWIRDVVGRNKIEFIDLGGGDEQCVDDTSKLVRLLGASSYIPFDRSRVLLERQHRFMLNAGFATLPQSGELFEGRFTIQTSQGLKDPFGWMRGFTSGNVPFRDMGMSPVEAVAEAVTNHIRALNGRGHYGFDSQEFTKSRAITNYSSPQDTKLHRRIISGFIRNLQLTGCIPEDFSKTTEWDDENRVAQHFLVNEQRLVINLSGQRMDIPAETKFKVIESASLPTDELLASIAKRGPRRLDTRDLGHGRYFHIFEPGNTPR